MSDAESISAALSALANLILAGAAVAASIAAFMGLDTWKKQQVWQRDHELARKFLIAVYSLRDSVYGVRNPFMYEGETIPDEESHKEEKDSRSAGKRRAYFRRWSKVREVQIEVNSLLWEADAVWGEELRRLFKAVETLNNELYVCVMLYIDELSETDPEVIKELRTARKERRDILYERSDPNDSFRQDYKSALSQIEVYLGAKFGRPSP